jgi:hypothetical protein
MNKKNFSAPAKLMKSKHNPKSEFHIAVSKILNIINNLQYENDKKKIDKVYNAKYPKDLKMPSDTYLLDKIYKKPRRKFTIIDVEEKKANSKASSLKPRRIFTITDAYPENKTDSKLSSSKSKKKFIITISNSNEKKMEKNIMTGAKTNSKNLNYNIID